MPLPTVPVRARPTRDIAALARAKERVRSTPIGATHPFVTVACRWLDLRHNTDSAVSSGSSIVTWLTFCAERAIDPAGATRHDARTYLVEVNSLGYTPNTINFRASVLRSIYTQAIEDGISPIDPFHGVSTPPKEPVTPTPALTSEQCARLVTSLSRPVIDGTATIHEHRNAAMAYVMIRVGPRRKEVAAAQWGHISKGEPDWAWRIHGKGNRWADTILPADVAEVVADWRSVLEHALGRAVRGSDAIFPILPSGRTSGVGLLDKTGDLRPLGKRTVSKIFTRLLSDVGISGPRFNAHAARATAATQAYAATLDLLAVQRMLRHRDQKTTASYIREQGTGSPAAAWRPAASPPIRPERADNDEQAQGAA
jgi:site-specific recombinase XerD